MILVTGGTGLVGAHLLFQLVKNGKAVQAIYRPKSDLERVKKVFGYYSKHSEELFEKIQWIEADLNDIPALEMAFVGVTHVYHAAALISFDPKDYKKMAKTNVEGTANIVNLCLHKGIQKLCYVSTIGTIGKNGEGSAAEENDELAQSKHEAELEVWRGAQEGLPVVMVNPGVIIGPGFWDSGSGKLFTTANKGYRYYPPGGTGFVSVGDVVKCMIRLMDSNIQNERFILVAENLSYKEVLEIMAPMLGKSRPVQPLKIWQLQLLRGLDWLRHLFTQKGRSLTGQTIESFKHRKWYSNEKIKAHLNFEFEPLGAAFVFGCAKLKEEHP